MDRRSQFFLVPFLMLALVSCSKLEKLALGETAPEFGQVYYAKSFGGSSSDKINGIVQVGGDIVFCGSTRNSYSVDGINVDANTTNEEFMIGRFSISNKQIKWLHTAGKKEDRSFCDTIAVDSVGNSYAAGTYWTDLNLGAGDLGSAGDRDVVLAKHDSDGNLLWGNSYGGTSGEEMSGLSISSADDVVTSGFYRSTVDFGSGNETSAGDSDGFIASYNSSGTPQFSSSYGLSQKDYLWDVAHDSSNNIYASGEMIGSVDLGGGALSPIGGRDIFLGKYDSSGNHIWSMNFGDTGEEYTRNIAVNGSGEVVVAGQSRGNFNVDGINNLNQGGDDIILVKVDSSGSIAWAKAFGTSASDVSQDVIFDEEGNVILLATFQETINIGGEDLVSNGGVDFLVAKFDSNGNHLASKSFGGTGDDTGRTVHLDSDGELLIGGSFSDTIQFTKTTGIVSNGSSDAFILKMVL